MGVAGAEVRFCLCDPVRDNSESQGARPAGLNAAFQTEASPPDTRERLTHAACSACRFALAGQRSPAERCQHHLGWNTYCIG